MRAPFSLLLLWLAMALAVPGRAAEAVPGPQSSPPRPRIGLVLSGGGARGAAHVGVLKVLEEMRVPIDAIAGTSMGAVVGGLYASGLSAAAIERQIDTIDWEDAFRDRPTRSLLNFRRRAEDGDFLMQLPLGFREGRLQLPNGLIQGQKLSQLLRELTLPVAGIASFDDLPTPFRAVATDLETGDAVVIGSGDLASALRASVSAPGIFAPVEREGRLLVDGGLANNLPVDIARAMGVDRVIVVDVGLPLASREQLGSATNVANQMLVILLRREVEKQIDSLTAGDVLVSPELTDTSSYNFTQLSRIVRAGTAAADKARARLAGLAVTPQQYEEYLAGRRHEPRPIEVRTVGVDAGSEAYAGPVEMLFGDLAGKTLDVDALRRRVARHYGQGRLELLDYRLAGHDASTAGTRTDLLFSARPNSWGPNYVRAGLRLQDDFEGNTSFDAALRLVLTDINQFGAEWIWDGQVGGNPRIGTELYLPFSLRRRWFLEPAALYEIRNVPQYEGDRQVGELRVRSLRYGGALGREIGNSGELRAGGERTLGESRVRLGQDAEAPVDFQFNELFARYSFDSLDSASFPRRGQSAKVEWRAQISDRQLERVSDSLLLDWRGVRSWDGGSLMGWFTAGSLLDPGFADERSYFPLGGFLHLSGLPRDSLTGTQLAMARLVYFHRLGRRGEGLLDVPFYAGASVEAGNVWQRRSDVSLRSARKNASLFVGLDTPLGPALFATGFDSRGRHAFYLSLGLGF
ncbi:MAG TPA: patatin-like phospholipase family protein [Steroidobacteraceae bacterium]|nr:patatin-like phospholipase family protein [Steroidobacteraceae bacterium]